MNSVIDMCNMRGITYLTVIKKMKYASGSQNQKKESQG